MPAFQNTFVTKGLKTLNFSNLQKMLKTRKSEYYKCINFKKPYSTKWGSYENGVVHKSRIAILFN